MRKGGGLGFVRIGTECGAVGRSLELVDTVSKMIVIWQTLSLLLQWPLMWHEIISTVQMGETVQKGRGNGRAKVSVGVVFARTEKQMPKSHSRLQQRQTAMCAQHSRGVGIFRNRNPNPFAADTHRE